MYQTGQTMTTDINTKQLIPRILSVIQARDAIFHALTDGDETMRTALWSARHKAPKLTALTEIAVADWHAALALGEVLDAATLRNWNDVYADESGARAKRHGAEIKSVMLDVSLVCMTQLRDLSEALRTVPNIGMYAGDERPGYSRIMALALYRYQAKLESGG